MRVNKKFRIGIMVLVLLGGGTFLLTSCNGKPASGQKEAKPLYYYCPMHTHIHLDKPGLCSICGMNLVPKFADSGTPTSSSPGVKKIKYWRDAMNPSIHSDKPGKAPDGMDLVPVYEEGSVGSGTPTGDLPDVLKGLAPVNLTPWRQQLIGVKFALARKNPLTRMISTVGRFAGGGDDFASAAGDFAATGVTSRQGARYLVADVYALDIPLVKAGERAWVSSFSGSGPKVEGKVTQIFPFDETQSRVARVRVQLLNPMPRELFANVEIEVVTPSELSVPSDAVLDTGLHQYVYVQRGAGNYVPRSVTVGFKGDDLWEITSGLEEGEQVVSGANFLVDADAKLNGSSEEGGK